MNKANYTLKIEDLAGWKLATFYGGKTVINGGCWTIDGFVNSPEKYEIKRIDFFQGSEKEHDSHHVLYRTRGEVV